MFTTVVPWFCQVHGAIFSILAQDAGPACLHWSFPSKRRGPGLPSTRTVKTTEQARFPLLQVMRGRSSNWKDVDDCASVSRQTFAGRVGHANAHCSAVIKNPMIRDAEQFQVGAHWQSSASWQQTIAHFLDFVFCLSCNQQR
jgi:hypothetical protein